MEPMGSVAAAVSGIPRVRPSPRCSPEGRASPPTPRVASSTAAWERLFSGTSRVAAPSGGSAAAEVAVHDDRTRSVLLVARQIMVQLHHTAAEASVLAGDAVPAPTYTTISSQGVQTEVTLPAPVAATPEAGAQRIVEFATGLFPTYAQGRPAEELGQAAATFAKLAQDAVATGAAKAQEILGSVPDEAAADIQATVQLAQQGLADWAAKLGGATQAAAA